MSAPSKRDLAVEGGVGVAREREPVGGGALERLARRGERPATQISDGLLVRGDHAAPRARLDREVAQGQPALHRERANRLASVFDGVARRPVGPDAGDDRKRDVLRADARARGSIDTDAHALRLLLPERLRHQHMGDLRGADPERVGAERAVRRGVAVAADDEEARQGQPLLRPDHMDDALARVVEAEQRDPVRGGIRRQPGDHAPDVAVRNAGGAGAGRHVVIRDAEGEIRAGDAGAERRELVEGMEGTLVDEVAIDPEQGRAVLAGDDLMARQSLSKSVLGVPCVLFMRRFPHSVDIARAST